MTERWELVELIGQTLLDQSMDNLFTEDTSEAILDSVENLVRADERGRQEEGWAARLNSTVAWAENGVRADLRAKVEALRAEDPHHQPVRDAYDAVLALLNGETL